ncbi:hypothetical protein FOM02_41000 [Bradyrhizobium sp. SEMIA]|nr:hypothetical protein FOM02_41000 [Bradyrhizobium sp. SEMIA]
MLDFTIAKSAILTGQSVSNLPSFKYHPDPVATGSVQKSDVQCICCGQARGYVYIGPVYAAEELCESLCPWCVADGSAHGKHGASFTDESGAGARQAAHLRRCGNQASSHRLAFRILLAPLSGVAGGEAGFAQPDICRQVSRST